ncbi:MAG: hypothetical protein JO316_15965 [Abitibacteriaceae bacterium]|nr:hypothetical protein [Abditibacteriaceae bacterium]MBV9866852.1 hypothetical protein [Abditibacteriaceae bacterium]
MFQTQKFRNVAPIGTAGINVHSAPLRQPARQLQLLGALPLVLLALLTPGTPVQAAPAVTVMPGSTGAYTKGMPVAVIAATDSSGDVDMARRALVAANNAITHWPGYTAISPNAVASTLSRLNIHGELVGPDYMNIGKKLKAQRLLTITLMPGQLGDNSANYTAVAEMYDSNSGGIVGRGEAPFTATPDTLGTGGGPTGSNIGDTLRRSAVDNAVAAAIQAIDDPAPLHGVVVSLPDAYQARISLGERNGIRNGARIEYLINGQPIAYGTVVDVGTGEALATIAAEAAAPAVMLNTEFRTVSNPSLARAGLTSRQVEDKAWRKYERDFVIGAIPALAYQYYLYGF